jgi:hypothetical protein
MSIALGTQKHVRSTGVTLAWRATYGNQNMPSGGCNDLENTIEDAERRPATRLLSMNTARRSCNQDKPGLCRAGASGRHTLALCGPCELEMHAAHEANLRQQHAGLGLRG